MGANYNLVLLSRTGTPLQSFINMEGFHVEMKLNGPCVTPNLIIDGRVGVEIESVLELATDFVLYRDDFKMYRGRIQYTQDNLGVKKHTVTMSSTDYRALLDRKILWSDLNYNGIDQSQIAWNLITHAQTQPGGNLGITRGTGQTTARTRIRPYSAGQNVGTLIEQLSEVIDGFEYEVDANLDFNVYYPQRGTEKDFVFEYGGSVEIVSRTVSSSDFANAIRGSGEQDIDGNAPSATAVAGNITTAPEGRWEKQIGYPDVKLQTTIQEKVEGDLVNYATIRPSYTLTLVKDVWNGPSDFWLGDTVQLVIKSGRLNVVTQVRVYEIDIKLNENNEETVVVTVNAPKPTLAGRLRRFNTRLDILERH